MIVVDDDLLGFVFKLYISFNISVPESGCRLTSRGNTYLMLNDSTKALDPKKAIATEGVDEEALAREHSLGELLRRVVVFHAACRGQKSVSSDLPFSGPGLVGVDRDGCNVTETVWCKHDLVEVVRLLWCWHSCPDVF